MYTPFLHSLIHHPLHTHTHSSLTPIHFPPHTLFSLTHTPFHTHILSAPAQCLYESISLLDILCSVSRSLINGVFPTIRRVYARCTQNPFPNARLLLALVKFFLNHGVCMCVCACVCACVCLHACMCVRACMCVCMCIHACMCVVCAFLHACVLCVHVSVVCLASKRLRVLEHPPSTYSSHSNFPFTAS